VSIIVDVKERIFLAKRFISYAKYPSLDSTLDQAAFRLVMKPFMLASALVDGMYRVHALWYAAAVSLYLLSVLLFFFVFFFFSSLPINSLCVLHSRSVLLVPVLSLSHYLCLAFSVSHSGASQEGL